MERENPLCPALPSEMKTCLTLKTGLGVLHIQLRGGGAATLEPRVIQITKLLTNTKSERLLLV